MPAVRLLRAPPEVMAGMLTLTSLYGPIARHLPRVEDAFDRALQSDLPCVDGLCGYLRRWRGKMLRPVLVLLAGDACGRVSQDHVTLAAVVEMVHVATLVHDDVLDEADLRRNALTVNRMTNNETAVMLGDFLISRSFQLCSSIGCQTASQIVAQAAAAVCEGELMQLSTRGNWHLHEDEYLAIIDRKTAALTAAACRLGAQYAGADPDAIRNLEAYGRRVGLAFQIADDVLDVAGTEHAAGKTLGTDARKGKLTLPLIHDLRTASIAERTRMLDDLDQARHPPAQPELLAVLRQAGSLDYALDLARTYVAAAQQCLFGLPDTPARASLQALADSLVDRDHCRPLSPS